MTSIEKALQLIRNYPRVTLKNIKDLPRSVPPGLDNFVTPVNIEVQYASESVIAAVERAGGVITTRFYDLFSVWAKSDPLSFFKRGIPIPRAKLPSQDAMVYYGSAESRGYIADPSEVAAGRVWLAQKYAYPVVDFSIQPDEVRQLMSMRKDPRQIFYGLAPGWLISLKDRVVLKPKSEQLNDYYRK